MDGIPRKLNPNYRSLLALRVALVYALLGFGWIYFSDVLMGEVAAAPQTAVRFAMMKGSAFILITSLLIFFLVHRGVARIRQAEQALVSTEAEYRELVENANSIVLRMDAEGKITFINKYARRFLGHTRDELVGRSPVGHVMPEVDLTGRKTVDIIQEMLRTPESFPSHASEIMRADGERAWIAWTNIAIRDSGGGVIGILCIGNDITERKRAEEALLESDRRFRELFENVHLISLMLDTKGNLTFCNDYLLRLSGWNSAEVIGRNFFDLFLPPDARAIAFPMFFESFLTGDVQPHSESEMLTRNGEKRLIAWNNTSLRDTAGNIIGFTSIGEDITERKRAEEALRVERNKLKNILDAMPDGAIIINRNYGIEYVNPAIQKVFGPVPEHWACYRYFHGAESACPACRALKVIKEGDALQFECRFPGVGKTFEIFDTPLANSDGTFSILSFFHDITHLKESEEQVRFQAQLLDNVREAVVAVDLDGRITWWGKGAEAFLGFREHEALGKPVTAVFSLDEGAEKERWKSVYKNGSWHGRIMKGKKDGSKAWAETHLSLVSNDQGEPVGMVAISHDITERRRLEDQLRQAQKMEAIGTLAGGIAHDFNNILAIIIGYTEMGIGEVSESNPVRGNFEQVLHAAHRAKDLVKQILAFSRHDGQRDRRPFEVGLIIKESLNMLRASLPSTIEIQHDIQPGMALVDPTQINQILFNLSTNAAHAMNDHGVLGISLAPVELDSTAAARIPGIEAGSYLRLSLSDTGHGMEAATIERIFDPYFTTKEVGKGTGLGLAVVHGIVKRHEGAIAVRSEPGKGTTLDIYLPCIEDKPDHEARGTLPVLGGTERILFVDDEELLAEVGKKLLESLGYEVTSSTRGPDALELFRASPDRFDLLITDYTMPRMTGLALAEEVLRIRPDLPVILCTGYSERVSKNNVKEAGIRDLVMKPLDRRELAGIVRAALGPQGQ